MRTTLFLIPALLALLPPEALAQEAPTCNQAYDAGDYAAAADCFAALPSLGALEWFNLGDARFRQGQLGPAIAAWRNAQELAPRDPDVAINLAMARSLLSDDLPVFSRAPIRRYLFLLADSLSIAELLWASILLWLALCFVFATKLLGRPLPLAIPLALGLGLFLSSGSTGWRLWELNHHPQAIVLVEEVQAMSGRDHKSLPLFVLHEGSEVRIQERRGDWLRIEISTGLQGWVKEAVLHSVNVW